MGNERSFEEALKRLEEIVSILENGDLPLDDSLKLFEEGAALSRTCNKKLDEAQQKITQIYMDNEPIKTFDP